MSYREWDQGKDWNSQGDWNQGRSTRAREEDDYYYGGGKRQRYNNYGDSSYDGGSQSHWNQSQSQSHSHDHSYNEHGGHRNRRMTPSDATQHIIFLGLDPDHTEGDLQAYLQSQNCALDSVTIIRDRGTGLSKGFGFAQFTTVEGAKAFLQPNFPFINVPPPASHGASAAAAFKQAMANGGHHQGRRVKIDFSQSAHNSDRSRPRPRANDGTRDIGTSPAPVLLLRGIDAVTTPAAVVVALKGSCGPGHDGTKALKRVLLVKDKMTGLGSGFAFLEFVDQENASMVLGSIMSPQIHQTGFRVNDKPIAASYAHPFSFQALGENELTDDSTVASSRHLGGGEGFSVRYWDEASSIAEMAFDVEEPAEMTSVPDKKEKKKKRAMDADVSAFLGTVSEEIHAAETVASTLPVSDKPVTLSLNKSLTLGTKTSNAPLNRPAQLSFASLDSGDNTEGGEALSGNQLLEDEKVTAAKKVAPLIASKKVANNINKWNIVQEELSGKASAKPPHAATPSQDTVITTRPQSDPKSGNIQQIKPAKKESSVVEPSRGEFEFADSKKMACYLCSRQFKTLDQLRRHNNESELHKKNLGDPSLRQIARDKASASLNTLGSVEGLKYRDRAQERRILHNQPEIPTPEDGNGSGGKSGKRRGEVVSTPAPPPAPVAPGKDESNIGNKLLQKMGWSSGMGLGTEGEGRVDPIETAIYAQGAGLGASKGKEIGKLTEGYSGYVNMARESARERYEDPR